MVLLVVVDIIFWKLEFFIRGVIGNVWFFNLFFCFVVNGWWKFEVVEIVEIVDIGLCVCCFVVCFSFFGEFVCGIDGVYGGGVCFGGGGGIGDGWGCCFLVGIGGGVEVGGFGDGCGGNWGVWMGFGDVVMVDLGFGFGGVGGVVFVLFYLDLLLEVVLIVLINVCFLVFCILVCWIFMNDFCFLLWFIMGFVRSWVDGFFEVDIFELGEFEVVEKFVWVCWRGVGLNVFGFGWVFWIGNFGLLLRLVWWGGIGEGGGFVLWCFEILMVGIL